MAATVGSGLGGSVVIAQQATYGGTVSFTTNRAPTFKTFKPTHMQHPVQGGPYLRNGELVDDGSARVLTYLDATGTLTGDFMSVGMALLLASALGSTATLTAIGTTSAYQLGGASGASIGAPDLNNTFVDLQTQAPDAGGTLHTFTYHSGLVTKAVWVFDRTGLVSYEYDFDFQEVETTTTAATVTEPGGPVPFTMANSSSAFKVGTFGSEAAVDGVRKCTITLDRKVKNDRIYLGNQLKDLPVSNDKAKITVALDCDYTSAAKTAIFDLQLAGTPISVVCSAVGSIIAGTAANTFSLNPTNCFVDTGGEAPLDGPDIIHNTINLSGTIDTAGDAALKSTLITPDTSF